MGVVTTQPQRTGLQEGAPRILTQSAIPFVLAQGTGGSGAQPVVSNNGAIASLANLGTTHEGAWMYFPANTIDGANAAGWYWFVGSSATAGTVYNNQYAGGAPTPPASLTAFVSTGPGAFTQTTATVDAVTGTLPGGALGPNGALRIFADLSFGATAVDRIWEFQVNSTAIAGTTIAAASSTNAGTRQAHAMRNRNRQDRQVCTGFAGYSNTSSAGVTYFRQINTSIDQTWKFTLRLSSTVASSFIALEAHELLVQFGA